MIDYLDTKGRDFNTVAAAIVAAGGQEASEHAPLAAGRHRLVLSDYISHAPCARCETAAEAATAVRDLIHGRRMRVYDTASEIEPHNAEERTPRT